MIISIIKIHLTFGFSKIRIYDQASEKVAHVDKHRYFIWTYKQWHSNGMQKIQLVSLYSNIYRLNSLLENAVINER